MIIHVPNSSDYKINMTYDFNHKFPFFVTLFHSIVRNCVERIASEIRGLICVYILRTILFVKYVCCI